jgi:hypothetical protein
MGRSFREGAGPLDEHRDAVEDALEPELQW